MWVARDKSGRLRVYLNKPFRFTDFWWSNDKMSVSKHMDIEMNVIPIASTLFPDLTFEDEPLEVCLVPQKDVDNFINVNEKDHEEFVEYVKNLREP